MTLEIEIEIEVEIQIRIKIDLNENEIEIESAKGKRMKAFGILASLLMVLMSAAASAQKSLYVCRPLEPSSLEKVVVVDGLPGTYELSLIQKGPQGEPWIQTGEAKYYDDVSYFGYYSESLKAGLELNDPDWQAPARLFLGGQTILVSCQR